MKILEAFDASNKKTNSNSKPNFLPNILIGAPFTCFEASNYGVLILADLEEEYYPDELAKLHADIRKGKLSIIVLADWYNTEVHSRFC